MCSDDAPAPPPPPDYKPIADAQIKSAELSSAMSQEQFDWAKQVYAENKGVTDKVVENFLATQAETTKNALADRARYEQVYQPLEDSLVRDAKDYASPERKAIEMGRAQANVAQQFGAARVAAQRDLEAFGINPAASRFAALDIGVRAQEAATKAGAGNQAAQMVDATGRALRSEAINIGRGYPGQVAGTYGTALAAGSGANGQTLATTASGANTMGTGTQWGAQAANSYTGAVNTTNTGYNNQMQNYNGQMAQYKADQENGWGQIVGLAAGMGASYLGAPRTTNTFMADGGAVPEQVSPSRGVETGDVPARLNVGEFIVPEETVKFKGTEFFYKLIEKSRETEAEMKESSGAVPTIHPGAMGAPSGTGRPQAVQVS